MLSNEQTLNIGLFHFQNGQLAEAEKAYQEVLARDPNNPDALHLLGLLARQGGRLDIAADLITRAIQSNASQPMYFYNLGLVLQKMGGTQGQPGPRIADAIACYREALRLKPDYSQAYFNLAGCLLAAQQPEEAILAYQQAARLNPDHLEAHFLLGNIFLAWSRLDEAILAYEQALRLRRDHTSSLNNMAIALRAKGRFDESIEYFRRAIASDPLCADAHNGLGVALLSKGMEDEAIASYRRALQCNPGFPEAHNNLANILRFRGQLDEALASTREALRLNPAFADAHYSLGHTLIAKGLLDEGIASFRQALRLSPGNADLHNSLGLALKDRGEMDEAVACHRRAVAIQPQNAKFASMLIFALEYHPAATADEILAECRHWNRQFAEPLRHLIQAHANDRAPDRPLRIGYVSPDLRQDVTRRFMLSLLSAHDRSAVQVFCYAQHAASDSVTEQLRTRADEWRVISGMPDEQVADLIRQDQIDILVDLSLHTLGNRLSVFARRPAPVQVSYLAYCSTTGLETIDYRFTDPYLDLVDSDPGRYSEESIRLQHYVCYPAPPDAPPVNELPALAPGATGITFGCLNNFCKVSDHALEVWSRLLLAVPNSRLLLRAKPGSHRDRVLRFLADKGLDPARCQFIGFLPSVSDYFRTYHQIDIALDPFPYAGGTTTCDALWMGVPIITLAGTRAVGRQGVSILSHLGLTDLIAEDEDAYVRIASNLAGDMGRLKDLRATLHQRMQDSPLMDASALAGAIEDAYRQMWKRWCARAHG